MRFGDVDLDPAFSPGILDTATWDPDAAAAALRRPGERWPFLIENLQGHGITVRAKVRRGNETYALIGLADGQQAFVRYGPETGDPVLSQPLSTLPIAGSRVFTVYPADMDNIAAFCHGLQPANAPRALGAVPRLGIGCRMTTAVWPGAFAAMDSRGFAANTIQNSVRELNLLDDLLAGRPPIYNYACGFGTIASGYTGSTFEGLWVAGVLAALAHKRPLRYGADADQSNPSAMIPP